MYERLYSNDLSESIPEHLDPRISIGEQELDISDNLCDQCMVVSTQEQLIECKYIPLYEKLFDNPAQ